MPIEGAPELLARFIGISQTENDKLYKTRCLLFRKENTEHQDYAEIEKDVGENVL